MRKTNFIKARVWLSTPYYPFPHFRFSDGHPLCPMRVEGQVCAKEATFLVRCRKINIEIAYCAIHYEQAFDAEGPCIFAGRLKPLPDTL